MRAAGYNLLGWAAPAGGYAVREVEGDPLEFWQDADGALVTGGDPGFCRTVNAPDAWLFADSGGNPDKPDALANVPVCPASDTQTPVRIVPDGGDAPRIPPQTPPGTFTVYRVGLRCHRLLQAKNVVLAEGEHGGLVCNFSNALLSWAAPREESAAGSLDPEERPVAYAPGNDWRPSELADFDVSCALAPVPGGMGGNVYPTFLPDGKTKWGGDGHRITAENQPMYVRDYWTSHWNGTELVKTRHELYWSPTTDAAESVRQQLETKEGLLERVFGLYDPPAEGTAFDLLLLCKTYWWYGKRNKTIHDGPTGTKPDGTPKGIDIVVWEWFGSGYFNTKLSGWLVQIAPVPPKRRSA